MYKVEIRPQHERIEIVSALDTPTANKIENWFVYEGKSVSLSKITLPLDVPIYRMANGRTQTDQLAYIAAAKAPEDFFSANEENVVAQREQHRILTRFAKDVPDSITPIIDELERTGQTKPILITPSGVVLDGNRRLCAMRELYDTDKYPQFAQVECEVLPLLGPDQLDDVEDRLQMRPETKLPYTWINDAIRLKKRLKSKKESEVIHLMRREKAEIKKAVGALNYADIYLRDWKHEPANYALVAGGRQFFADLTKALKGKEGALLEANMRLAWMLFDNREGLGSRVYDFNRIVGEKASEVLQKLAERIDLDDEEPEEETDDTELEIDFGEESEANPYGSLIKALDSEDRREEIAEELRVVCQNIIDAGKATKTGQSALVAARDANTRLTELDLDLADPKTWDGIDKQLEAIIERATELRTKLKEIRQKASEASSD